MGLSRMLYGTREQKGDLSRTMLRSGLLCVVCYLLAALSPWAGAGPGGVRGLRLQRGHPLAGGHQPLLPGVPQGRHRHVRLLALAGDFGATVSPAVVGTLSEWAGGNLKTGLLAATVFPLLLVGSLFVLNRRQPAVRP